MATLRGKATPISPETWKIRQAVLMQYGGRCTCPCGCQESNLRRLQIHHGEGRSNNRGQNWYRAILGKPHRRDLRVWCVSCYWEETLFGMCEGGSPSSSEHSLCATPDVESIDLKPQLSPLQQKQLAWYQDRWDILNHYGRICACCGSKDFLEIDHIEGGGRQHRRDLGSQSLESWIKEQGYPETFQILCNRCNRSKLSGPSCRIDHSRDIMNESEGLRPKTRADLIRSAEHYPTDEQADQLVALNTRIPKSVKAILQAEADARGVALGVIIAERVMNTTLAMQLHRIEQQVEALSIKLSTPTSSSIDAHGSPQPSDPFGHLKSSTWTPDPLPETLVVVPPKRRWLWGR